MHTHVLSISKITRVFQNICNHKKQACFKILIERLISFLLSGVIIAKFIKGCIAMLIWGSSQKIKELNIEETHYCQHCQKDLPFKSILTYRCAHLWYLFRSANKAEYLFFCTICNFVIKANSKEMLKKLNKNPIPAFDRWGALYLILIIAFCYLWR